MGARGRVTYVLVGSIELGVRTQLANYEISWADVDADGEDGVGYVSIFSMGHIPTSLASYVATWTR